MVQVPLELMYTLDSVPQSFFQRFNKVDDEKDPGRCTVHCILAAFLTLGSGDPEQGLCGPWGKSWPTRKDFEDTMPILWPQSVRCLPGDRSVLPPSISGGWNTVLQLERLHDNNDDSHLLAQQERRLQRDWERVLAVFPDTDWEAYSYNWLIVNTRCFFYLMPGDEPPEDPNDAMAMVPFADYFNHSDEAVCILTFGPIYKAHC